MNDPAIQPSPETHRRVGHETTDASPFYVGLFALGLTLMIVLVLPVLAWLFWRFEAEAKMSDAPQSPLPGDQTPRAPKLQDDPAADLLQFRSDEEQRLSSYGWIDPQRQIVRLPIGRAIELLSERGLPAPAGPVELPKGREHTP
ncbi:MAG TPA: hypothetical protein VGM05_12135 [Planctomycetaceae bacterium]|jgi:hypothetical protein